MSSVCIPNCDNKCFEPFRFDERILNSKRERFIDKVVSLINIWDIISEMNIFTCTIEELIQILEWAKLHALNIILQAEWTQSSIQYQSLLEQKIEMSKFQLAKADTCFIVPCEKLLDVIRSPWQHHVLLKLLLNNEPCSDKELLDFFRMETGYLTAVRIMKLCQSRCEDMAMNLANHFIGTFHLSCAKDQMIQATHAQVWYIFDVYISLLYKYGNRHKTFEMLKGLTSVDGLNLVRRMVGKNTKLKVWALSPKIARYASQIYITQVAYNYSDQFKDILKDLIHIYYILCTREGIIPEFINTILRISEIVKREGLHRLCDILHNLEDLELRALQFEIYIKVITIDINQCETSKDDNETEQVEYITTELAKTFCKLSSLLNDHIDVARECVLTAFSLKPTEERLKMLESYAVRSGMAESFPVWKCERHPPILKSDDIMWICSECGEWMTKPQLKRLPENNIGLHQIFRTELLGIPQTLCDDLSVCIAYSRYQILSWYQTWNDLHHLCIMYLRDPVATKNFITELKYVDIDYSMFRHIKKEPIDGLTGIEKGYEMYLGIYDEDSTSSIKEEPQDSYESTSSGTSSTMKEFIVKLKPLHITADFFVGPKVLLERDNDIQQIVNNIKLKN